MTSLKKVALFSAFLVLAPATHAHDIPNAPKEISITIEEQSLEKLADYFNQDTFEAAEKAGYVYEQLSKARIAPTYTLTIEAKRP